MLLPTLRFVPTSSVLESLLGGMLFMVSNVLKIVMYSNFSRRVLQSFVFHRFYFLYDLRQRWELTFYALSFDVHSLPANLT